MKKPKKRGRVFLLFNQTMKKKLKKDPTLKASSMETTIDNLLPEDIMFDIFSRLPAVSILKCRRVCKTWRALTYHPCFANIHARRQLQNLHDATATQVGFIRLVYSSKKSLLYYGQYNENDVKKKSYNKTLTRVNHRALKHKSGIVGSCNGLICLSERRLGTTLDPVYVCNPITREFINLPRFTDVKKGSGSVKLASGFGYNLSTNEYKVVRICYHVKLYGHVQVYTLASGTGWRSNSEKTSHYLGRFSCDTGVFVNGALHWLDTSERKIVAFDLADEKFRVLPSPPCLDCQYDMQHMVVRYELMELGGCLCLLHKVYQNEVGLQTIWTFKKIKISSYYEEYESSWSWIEEINSMTTDKRSRGSTLALIKSGEVLLCFDGSFLCRYDPKTACLEKLWDYGQQDMQFRSITTHINSFVSLKSLGEDPEIIESINDKSDI